MNNLSVYDRKAFAAGAVIVKSDDPAYNAYLIQSGTAAVFREGPDGPIEVGHLEVGDIIGDMAIIRQTKHLSTVVAKEPLIAVVIPQGHIEKCIQHAEPLIRTLLQGMIRRIDHLNAEG